MASLLLFGCATPVKVVRLNIVPFGTPQGLPLPDPILLCAGGVDSPADKAYVIAQTAPEDAGRPIRVWLEGGFGHTVQRDARITFGGTTVTADGRPEILTTDPDGILRGVLVSSDVLGEVCIVHAGELSGVVVFNWDESRETGWVMPVPDVPPVGTNRVCFRLTHYRDKNIHSPSLGSAPIAGHKINFFVEGVTYVDSEGIKHALTNTPNAPSDLSDWAFFAPQEVVSVADGTASSDLVVKRQVADVEVSVYDFSVFDTCRNSTGAVTNACNYCTVKRSHNSVRKSCTVDAQYLGATVRQLGADAPDARRRARNVLRAFGPAAYDVMRQYRKDANPEIRMTIQELLNEHLSRESGKGEAVDRD